MPCRNSRTPHTWERMKSTMAKGLSIASEPHVRVFQCPQCKETLNTSMQQCPFCSAAIDPDAAGVAAELMARVNQDCSDASYLRIMAGTMVTFFFLRFLPIVSVVGAWGHLFLLVAVPVMTIRWWVKFGSLKMADPDFRTARKSTLAAGGIWLIFAVIFCLPFLVAK